MNFTLFYLSFIPVLFVFLFKRNHLCYKTLLIEKP